MTFPIPGLRELEALYQQFRENASELTLPERLIQHLRVTHRIADKDLNHVPRKGAAVVVANHPFGVLEGAVLAMLLSQLRPDVRILANGVLAAIPELRDLVIAVDPMGGARATRRNPGGLRQSIEHLANGGLLVVFPAGEVSHYQWKERAITDSSWSPAVARLLSVAARRAPSLAIIPTHIEGANSKLFQLAGLLHPRLRTALLARELLNKRGAQVSIRMGSAIAVDKLLAIPTDAERMDYLRWRTYLLASRHDFRARTAVPLKRSAVAEVPVADPVPATLLKREIEALPASAALAAAGDLTVYLARAQQIPNLLQEIGRLRELTFRAAGEGTGAAVDLDHFDSAYQHLFVWNAARCEIVGAYRLAETDRVSKLYTATLFDYGDAFLNRMGPALELGRSFVRAEYQKSFGPLLLLWNGIGKYVASNPRYKVLFGPVSISNEYQSISRELMVSFLERHASLRDWMGLVATKNPFRKTARTPLPQAGFDLDDLSAVVSDLEPTRAGVPILLRQYLKLGGKLLGFNIDPKFSNALDGLIVVDLTKTEPRLLSRYLGKAEAAEFIACQKGSYAA